MSINPEDTPLGYVNDKPDQNPPLSRFPVKMKGLRLRLPEELRAKLKEPLGELLTGDEEEILRKVRLLIRKEKPARIVSVGDSVSRLLLENKIETDLIIIDWREKRRPCRDPLQPPVRHIFKMANKPGYLEGHVWSVVREALKKGDSAIIVEGEEDLLVLPVAVQAPPGTLIFYGQPGVGVVAIKVTEKFKHFLETEILNRFIIE